MKHKYLFLSFIPFLLCAYFSQGFLHPDEHYQILELLNLKIGSVRNDEIFNWDFQLHMRGWFQPFLYFLLAKISFIKNPFYLATFFRFVNAILGWLGLYLLSRKMGEEKEHRGMSFMAWFWFVPFLLVRTSSEALSTSFFLIGAWFFLQTENKKAAFSGVLFGMSFLCRFQMGIPIAAATFWRLITKKDWKGITIHLFFVILMIGLGVLIDHWGYGDWEFTPYNYLKHNILESRASEFGTSPIWYYFTAPLFKGGFPLVALLLFGTILYWKNNKKDFWTVTTLSFLIIHLLIPHKELRFLAFIYILTPYFVWSSVSKKGKWMERWWKLAFVTNIFFLAKTFLTPAHTTLGLYQYIYSDYRTSYLTPMSKSGEHFKFTMPFYQRQDVQIQGTRNLGNGTFVTTTYDEYHWFSKFNMCHLGFSNYPNWVLDYNFFHWRDHSAVLAVWECSELR